MKYNPVILKKLITKEHIIELLESLGAHSIHQDSNGIRSSCPIHQSKNGTSFVYNYNLHLYNCYSDCNDNENSGDLINLVENVKNYNYEESVEYICDICNIDIKLIESSVDFLLDDLKISLDNILEEISDREESNEDESGCFGVKPVDESLLQELINKKDSLGYIDSQGFKDSTLELFESSYDDKEKRWLLPIRSPDGILLGFDGRDVTNKSKIKWKKRKNLKKNKLLGSLDIVGEEIQKENKIILVEGKKDQIAVYEADLKHVSCIYGSTFSLEQKELIDSLIDNEIIIAPDGDKAGYSMVQSIIKLAYPEYYITVLEIPDEEDCADLSKKYLLELYENRISVEEWLKLYEYRTKKKS